MLYLNHEEEATDEDIENDLVYWAKAFKAKTWEELKKIAKMNPMIKEVAERMYEINADTMQRAWAEAHEKYVCTMASIRGEGYRAGLEAGREEVQSLLDARQAEIEELKKQIEELKK